MQERDLQALALLLLLACRRAHWRVGGMREDQRMALARQKMRQGAKVELRQALASDGESGELPCMQTVLWADFNCLGQVLADMCWLSRTQSAGSDGGRLAVELAPLVCL